MSIVSFHLACVSSCMKPWKGYLCTCKETKRLVSNWGHVGLVFFWYFRKSSIKEYVDNVKLCCLEDILQCWHSGVMCFTVVSTFIS